MPRQPISGAGAAVRSPSGEAARAAALSPSPLPSLPLSPERYRALRARYNALVVALYERSSLTQREIAMAAGRTERAMQMLVRRLGCLPRNAGACRPGTDVGVRRSGERPPPLNGPATRRTVEAFTGVARELAASALARAADDLQRATARATRRSAQAQSRVMIGAARSLSQVAATIDDTAALQETLAGGSKRNATHPGARKGGSAPQPPSRAEMERRQERMRYQQEALMYEARARDRANRAARLAAARDAEAARRSGIAERADDLSRQRPRIRRL